MGGLRPFESTLKKNNGTRVAPTAVIREKKMIIDLECKAMR